MPTLPRPPLFPSRRHPWWTGAVATAAALATALTGCGSGPTTTADSPPAEGYPVTVDNCGTEVRVDAPPERAATLNQHATEIMLALGLADRMVGTAFLDDQVLPEYRAAYADIPVLAEEYPSFERLVAAEPDFVYAGFGASAFDPAEGRGRDALASAGIDTYTNIEECADEVTMDTVGTEIRNVGRIFGVADRADALVADIEDQVAKVEKRVDGVEPVDVLVVDSIGGTVFTAGGRGIGSEIIERAGGRNVFDDVDDAFADVSIEQAAERSPDAILIYDYGETSVREKKRALLSDPTLASTPAVERKRFAVLPLSSAVVGVRVGDAVTAVAEQLHPDRF